MLLNKILAVFELTTVPPVIKVGKFHECLSYMSGRYLRPLLISAPQYKKTGKKNPGLEILC